MKFENNEYIKDTNKKHKGNKTIKIQNNKIKIKIKEF